MRRAEFSLARWEIALLSAALLLSLLACNYAYLGHYVDDIVWVLLSRNFTRGSVMAAWSGIPRVETSATWGFSLLLTPVTALFYKNALALKVWSALLLFTGTALFYRAARLRFSTAGRCVYLLALFFNNFYLAFSGNVISEAGYMLIFGAAVHWAYSSGCLSKPSPRGTLSLGLLTSFLVMTRVIGLAFFAAAAFELAMGRRFKELFRYGATVGLGIAPYFLICKLFSGAYTYHAQGWAMLSRGGLPSALRAVGENAYFYLKGLSLLTFVYFPSFVPNIFLVKIASTAVIAGIALAGAVRCAKSPEGRFLAVYGLAYGLVCVAWPFQGARFSLPVYPLFLFWFLAGLASLLPERRIGVSMLALGILTLSSNFLEIKDIVRVSLTQAPDMPHESYLWLKDHSSPADLVVSMDIARIRYYGDRMGVHFVPSDSLESFVRRSRELGAKFFFLKAASYVDTPHGIADPTADQYGRLAEYLGHADYFSPVYENKEEQVKVYVLSRPRT